MKIKEQKGKNIEKNDQYLPRDYVETFYNHPLFTMI